MISAGTGIRESENLSHSLETSLVTGAGGLTTGTVWFTELTKTIFIFFRADTITLTAECDIIKALLHINESLFQERTFDYEKSID